MPMYLGPIKFLVNYILIYILIKKLISIFINKSKLLIFLYIKNLKCFPHLLKN